MTWFVLEKEREAEKFENKKIDLRVLEKSWGREREDLARKKNDAKSSKLIN
mgnify:CR=1 FL=1